MNRAVACCAVGAIGIATLTGCSSASKSATPTGGGVGTAVAVIAAEKGAAYSMTADPASVKTGPVTFTLTDTGTMKHEMVVLKTDQPFGALTVGADHKVSEDSTVGEVGEIDAGKTGTVTLDLKPGHYVLVCNIALQYGLGMRVGFTVTS